MRIFYFESVKFGGVGVFFDIFEVSKVITTAQARKSGVIFNHFSQAFEQKIRSYDQNGENSLKMGTALRKIHR